VRTDKNVQSVLRTFALLRQRNPQLEPWRLVLETSGDPRGLEGIKKTAGQYGLMDCVRFLHDMNDEERRLIFADAGALMIFGRAEGFGFPIIEAQLSGVPVIAADSGALPEIAGEHGAVLVDPDNQDDCVSVLERVLTSDNLRAYLIENGRINAGQFTWSRAVGDLLQIYELLFYPRDQVDLPQRRRLASRILEWLPF
jgi:glycosyltransferase involved in cell wall biosynthesis